MCKCENPLCDSGLKLTLFFLLIVLVGAVLVGVLNPKPMDVTVSAPQSPAEHLIYAGGTAMREVSPDLLRLSLGVETQEATAALSQSSNAEKINAIKSALLANGILADDIQTSDYSVSPVTTSRKVCPDSMATCEDWQATWVTEIVGYKTRHMLTVDSSNLDSAGTVVDAAVRAGANNVDTVSFRLKDATEKSLRDSLATEAMRDAKSKAEKIALGLGVSVGNVTSASVDQLYYPAVRNYADYAFEAASAGGTSMSPGQLTITVSASASFEIRQ
jgi:hypothetical protein